MVKGLEATSCTPWSYQDMPREDCNANANPRVKCSAFLPALFKQAENTVSSAFRRQMNPTDRPQLILVHHYSILCNKQENNKNAFEFLDNGHLPLAKVKNILLCYIHCLLFFAIMITLWAFPIFHPPHLPLSQRNCFLTDCGSLRNLAVQSGDQEGRGVIVHNASRSPVSKGQRDSNLSPALSLWCLSSQIYSVQFVSNCPSENSQLLHC